LHISGSHEVTAGEGLVQATTGDGRPPGQGCSPDSGGFKKNKGEGWEKLKRCLQLSVGGERK